MSALFEICVVPIKTHLVTAHELNTFLMSPLSLLQPMIEGHLGGSHQNPLGIPSVGFDPAWPVLTAGYSPPCSTSQRRDGNSSQTVLPSETRPTDTSSH